MLVMAFFMGSQFAESTFSIAPLIAHVPLILSCSLTPDISLFGFLIIQELFACTL
jgi:hypothetical protein